MPIADNVEPHPPTRRRYPYILYVFEQRHALVVPDRRDKGLVFDWWDNGRQYRVNYYVNRTSLPTIQQHALFIQRAEKIQPNYIAIQYGTQHLGIYKFASRYAHVKMIICMSGTSMRTFLETRKGK